MLDDYRRHQTERAALGIPPRPLTAEEVDQVVAAIRADGADAASALTLLATRVPPGVDDAARVKAGFLADVAHGRVASAAIAPPLAVELLGGMRGGYSVDVLIDLLDDPTLGGTAAAQLSHTLLVFDTFHDVAQRAKDGHTHAQRVVESWAAADWFHARPTLPAAIALTVFRVPGEVTTDDLSPGPEAWSRPDIPLHALALLETRTDVNAPVATLAALRQHGRRVLFVADVLGTGSSRKSATNSLLWHIGDDMASVPNKHGGGFALAERIAPIFATTLEDAGALPLVGAPPDAATGDVVVLRPLDGAIEDPDGRVLGRFEPPSPTVLDSVRAGGRMQLVIGRALTERARRALGRGPTTAFAVAERPPTPAAFTLAQKIVGRACGLAGVAPGTPCEPVVSTVGSQDTTGPMNRSELEELACLGFSADLVLQTFCHTAAYPKPVDIEVQRTLPAFMGDRGAVVLRPGDGIIHSWLNRMLLPDQVGTGSDSHTRFPLGISFPAGSGLVAFAAALGTMPLDMPESVLVRFRGELQPGVTLRDLVNAVPYAARQQGHLAPGERRNVFSGRIIEIEGLEHLTVEQAFELSDSTAERSAAACTIALSEDSVAGYLRSNVAMLRWLVDRGYQDARALERRALAMERWLAEPALLRADPAAEYVAVIEIDVAAVTEPLVACPNDPDDIRPLSAVAGRPVDEVFIGSCMTNIGHFRAAAAVLRAAAGPAPTRTWVAPPTRLDEIQLRAEGAYRVFAAAGARTETPGCSLCMGNQARVAPGATVVSTSTRNFPNRMGAGADVFLASAELAAVVASLGRLPTVAEYRARVAPLDTMAADIYRYHQFDQALPDDAPGAAAPIPLSRRPAARRPRPARPR